jgi:hypothetical protein
MMGEPKYKVPLTEAEVLLIARLRAGRKFNKNFDLYFWLAVVASTFLVIGIMRNTHNATAFTGFAPLMAFFIYSSLKSRQVKRETDNFVNQIKSQRIWEITPPKD